MKDMSYLKRGTLKEGYENSRQGKQANARRPSLPNK